MKTELDRKQYVSCMFLYDVSWGSFSKSNNIFSSFIVRGKTKNPSPYYWNSKTIKWLVYVTSLRGCFLFNYFYNFLWNKQDAQTHDVPAISPRSKYTSLTLSAISFTETQQETMFVDDTNSIVILTRFQSFKVGTSYNRLGDTD